MISAYSHETLIALDQFLQRLLGVSVDCARAESGAINSIPAVVTDPATAPLTATWRNFRREVSSFDKLGCESIWKKIQNRAKFG